ncbi:MAG: hypothetical protein M3Q81_04425 [bacterium]|nr:hypothetical protein [bacterium]
MKELLWISKDQTAVLGTLQSVISEKQVDEVVAHCWSAESTAEDAYRLMASSFIILLCKKCGFNDWPISEEVITNAFGEIFSEEVDNCGIEHAKDSLTRLLNKRS